MLLRGVVRNRRIGRERTPPACGLKRLGALARQSGRRGRARSVSNRSSFFQDVFTRQPKVTGMRRGGFPAGRSLEENLGGVPIGELGMLRAPGMFISIASFAAVRIAL